MHKIVFLGDSATGKTSIISQYIYGECSPDHQTTVGIDFFSKTMKSGTVFQIWDTAGQEKFHSLIPSYLRNSNVAIIVYDITQRSSFENIERWHRMTKSNPSIILVGNKTDLESSRCVTTEEGRKLAKSIGADFIETSARTPSNIQELFDIVSKIEVDVPEEPSADPIIISTPIHSEDPHSKQGCC